MKKIFVYKNVVYVEGAEEVCDFYSLFLPEGLTIQEVVNNGTSYELEEGQGIIINKYENEYSDTYALAYAFVNNGEVFVYYARQEHNTYHYAKIDRWNDLVVAKCYDYDAKATKETMPILNDVARKIFSEDMSIGDKIIVDCDKIIIA